MKNQLINKCTELNGCVDSGLFAARSSARHSRVDLAPEASAASGEVNDEWTEYTFARHSCGCVNLAYVWVVQRPIQLSL